MAPSRHIPGNQAEARNSGRGWCVPKATLLAACARVIGIPARVVYADVRNHLATKILLICSSIHTMRLQHSLL
jgi:transglutaminase-like putative cysteine protease